MRERASARRLCGGSPLIIFCVFLVISAAAAVASDATHHRQAAEDEEDLKWPPPPLSPPLSFPTASSRLVVQPTAQQRRTLTGGGEWLRRNPYRLAGNENAHSNALTEIAFVSLPDDDDDDDDGEEPVGWPPPVAGAADQDNNQESAEIVEPETFGLKSQLLSLPAWRRSNADDVDDVDDAAIDDLDSYWLPPAKRSPALLSNQFFLEPHYPYAYRWPLLGTPAGHANRHRRMLRQQNVPFQPSISIDALHTVGQYFDRVGDNVHATHAHQLYEDMPPGNPPRALKVDHLLLLKGGAEPLHQLQAGDLDDVSTKDLLHLLRTYRPSHHIRSLDEDTPKGYHGSFDNDPRYMWIGLG